MGVYLTEYYEFWLNFGCYVGPWSSMWNANSTAGVQFPACARSRMLTLGKLAKRWPPTRLATRYWEGLQLVYKTPSFRGLRHKVKMVLIKMMVNMWRRTSGKQCSRTFERSLCIDVLTFWRHWKDFNLFFVSFGTVWWWPTLSRSKYNFLKKIILTIIIVVTTINIL